MINTYLAFALLTLTLPVFGFNPSSIPRHQKNAPEQLEIEVTKIEEREVKEGDLKFVAMEVQATVRAVVESAAGIKEGQVIQVFWLIPQEDQGIGGGWPAKIQQGRYRAYLRAEKQGGKRYVPAAYTGSFVAEQ